MKSPHHSRDAGLIVKTGDEANLLAVFSELRVEDNLA